MLAKHLEAGSKDLRFVGISALQALFPHDDRTLVEVCKRFNHRSKHVRSHMRAAAVDLGGAGSPHVVAACMEGLQDDSNEWIRFDALRAVQQFLPEGNKIALEHVARTASEDSVVANQCLALELLCTMGKGCKVAMLVAAHVLGHRDADVVEQGFKTLVDVPGCASISFFKG